MSLKKLKNRKLNTEKLEQKLSDKRQRDERFWTLTVDSKQNGEAVIRFLPSVEGEEDEPIVKHSMYYIKTPKGFYVAPDPRNAGLKSFVNEANSKLWLSYKKTNDEELKKLFVSRMPQEQYIANILVVDDIANPENNGKVFLYRFGRSIKEMLFEAMGLSEQETKSKLAKKREPFDPFCFWNGANFNLIAYSKTGQAFNRSYDQSYFSEDHTPVSNDDNEIEEIYSKVYSLKEFTDPANYPSYEEEKEKFIDMTGDYYDLFPEEERVATIIRGGERKESSVGTKRVEKISSKDNDDDWEFENKKESNSSQNQSEDDDDDDVFSEIYNEMNK